MALNFADVAGQKMADIERPPLPPVGTYRFQITKLPESTTSNDSKWDILTINCRAVEALDDMGDYAGKVSDILQQVKFMFDKEDEVAFEKSLFRVRTFFESHVKCAGPKDTIAQAINASVNAEFLGTIAWSQDKKDPEMFWANIARTAPVE